MYVCHVLQVVQHLPAADGWLLVQREPIQERAKTARKQLGALCQVAAAVQHSLVGLQQCVERALWEVVDVERWNVGQKVVACLRGMSPVFTMPRMCFLIYCGAKE